MIIIKTLTPTTTDMEPQVSKLTLQNVNQFEKEHYQFANNHTKASDKCLEYCVHLSNNTNQTTCTTHINTDLLTCTGLWES